MNNENPSFALLALTVDLQLPEPGSLKNKRGIVKRLCSRLRNEFSCAVSETGYQDKWQRCEISIALIGVDPAELDRIGKKIEEWLEVQPDSQLLKVEYYSI